MCLIKYSTIEESINAVAFLHGNWLYGRYIIFLIIIFLDKFKYLSLNQKFDRIKDIV